MFPHSSKEGLKSIVYVGSSMSPLLHDLDILYFSPYGSQPLNPGDVIVFKGKKSNKEIAITHRIVSISQNKIVTKGDNNPNVDDGPINPADIIGTVQYAKRGAKTIKVHNGTLGSLYARTTRMISRLKTIIARLLVYPYHLLSRTGLFWILVQGNKRLKVIQIKRPDGIESQLMMGRFVVGKQRVGTDRWVIFPPFKLFIDEGSLPKNSNPVPEPITPDDGISL